MDYHLEAHFEDLEDGELLYAHNLLQVAYNKSTVKLRKDDEISEWKTLQFHFHAPTEHTINSNHYDVEVHFVHQNIDNPNKLLVIGVMFRASEFADDNKFIESLRLEDLPKRHSNLHVKAGDFMNDVINCEKFNYSGSLTTPPCSECVEWIVLRKIVEIPHFQADLFHRLWKDNKNFAKGQGTNREVQPLHDRVVNIIN